MIQKLQPPDDPVAPTLISGQVVQSQPAAGRRRRAEADVIATTVVSKGSPLASCWGFRLQRVSGANKVLAVAGDGGDVFPRCKIQSFFFAGRTIACRAPVGPHIIVPERVDIARSAFSPCADLGDVVVSVTNLDADCGQFPSFGNVPVTPGAFTTNAGGRRHH